MTHTHEAMGERPCVAIGPTVCLTPFVHGDDEHLAGFFTGFAVDGTDERLIGSVNVDPHFAGERPVWTMTGSLEGGDLSLSPSILFRQPRPGDEISFHGFVRDGHWVPA